MTDNDAIEERLRAVERAVADGEVELSDSTGELASRMDELESTATELESGLQAVRGYVGQVKSVDEEIEQRADAAAAAVDDVEERIAALERRLDADDAEADDAVTVPSDDRRRHAESRPERGRDRNRFDARGDRRPGDGDLPSDRRRERRAAPRHHARPASQPARPRPQTEAGSHDHDSGCPHCGGVATEVGGNELEGDGDPVDDVDEQSVVARLRDAL